MKINRATKVRQWSVIQSIAMQCKKHRMRIGYTQREVADMLGISQQSVTLFEAGRNNSMYIYQWYLDHGFKYEEV